MKFVILAILFLFAAPVTAQFWIPADNFSEHTGTALEGTFDVDELTGKPVQLLGSGQQTHIQIGLNGNLSQYLKQNAVFQVCALVANYGSGETNTVQIMHPTPLKTLTHILYADGYKAVCSEYAPIDNGSLQIAGVQVSKSSVGVVKVRGILFRSIEGSVAAKNATLMEDYEFSRALGYLWGDGSVGSNEDLLQYPKSTSRTSRHFESVASSYFGNALTEQGNRFGVALEEESPSKFLLDGLSLSDIPDKEAFLTSVIEVEGAVRVGRVADDGNLRRCGFIKTLVDSLNPQCSANTCTDASCSTPNCAFIADGNSRGTPHRTGTKCAAYLSGNASDWRSLFSDSDYHFVKSDRTPGGEQTEHSPDSRPSKTNTQPVPITPVVDSPEAAGYVFSRTDKNELRWIASTDSGRTGSIRINETCSASLGGPTAFGDWFELLDVAPAFDAISNPCFTPPSSSGYVFSRTDKSELRWVAPTGSGELGNTAISESCSESLGGPTAFGDWFELLDVSPAFDAIAKPCN